jgi:RHS repeat-associated protein
MVTNRYRSEYTYDANGNIETAQRWNANGAARYDSLHYHYHDAGGRRLRNRLYHLQDLAADGIVTAPDPDDLKKTTLAFDSNLGTLNTTASTNNYRYDPLGNLVYDNREGITNIDWSVAGKVRSVAKASGHSLAFAYGASGQRTQKQVGDPALDPTAYREHYIRDAQGNIMATYRYTNNTAASLKLNERPGYGSSRLGSLREEVELHTLPSFDPASASPVQMVDLNYELTDHLGNVCAVVTGRLLDGNGGGTAKQAELVSAQGYEPFGSLLPGRNYSSSSYDYGFNGMRKDDEMHGATGTSYDFGERIYDARIARFFSIDPIYQKYPWMSPYVFAANNPIYYVDVYGMGPEPPKIINRSNGSFMGLHFKSDGNGNSVTKSGDVINTQGWVVRTMMILQAKKGVEVSAFVLKSPEGALSYFIQDHSKNDRTTSHDLPEVAITPTGTFLEFDGVKYEVVAALHTHPREKYDSNAPSVEDAIYADERGVSSYVIGPDYVTKTMGFDDYMSKGFDETKTGDGYSLTDEQTAQNHRVASLGDVRSGKFDIAADAQKKSSVPIDK